MNSKFLAYYAMASLVSFAVGKLQIVTTLQNNANSAVWGSESSSVSQVASDLQNIEDSNPPAVSSVPEAISAIQSIYSNDVSNIVVASEDNIQKNLVSKSVLDILNGYPNNNIDSSNNTGNPPPSQTIYPSKSPSDAPYSVSQQDLQDAIFIPSSFSFGQNGKKPVILIPGTAVPAGITYFFSFEHLAQAAPAADVCWVNIPRASLDDAQINSEYVAYAINYISAVSSGVDVSIISWSQGGLDTQWALKYWPSTRSVLEDFIAISPDFHGTVEADFLCPGLDQLACTPSIWQQRYDANFASVLRSNGGDSAYVPTTSIYSSSDEIVQPQSGVNASGFMLDARDVGVSNNELQTVCAGQPAGGVYTHEGVLYNSLAWALAVDALNNPGPGEPARLNLAQVCSEEIAPEENLEDVLGTEGLLLIAMEEIGKYQPKTSSEPPIAPYAA